MEDDTIIPVVGSYIIDVGSDSEVEEEELEVDLPPPVELDKRCALLHSLLTTNQAYSREQMFSMSAGLCFPFCILGNRQRKALASEGTYLDDEVVTMTLK